MMVENIFKIPVSKYVSLYRTFNPRATFLVNLTDKNTEDLFKNNIDLGEDVTLENLENKSKNFSLKAPLKNCTIFYLSTVNTDFEKIIGVEEIYSIFLICNKESDQKKIKLYTSHYKDKKIGIILL